MDSVIFLSIPIISLYLLVKTILEVSRRAMQQKQARACPSHRSSLHDDAVSASDLRVIGYAFKANEPGRDEVVECPLCLSDDVDEGDEIRELKCVHSFHGACLDKWLMLARPATCPLCRSAVAPLETTPPTTTTGKHFRVDDEENDDRLMILLSYVDVNGCISRICEKLRGLDSIGCRANWILKG